MITLWELQGKNSRRYSLFSWRTRMALRHKGLDFDTVFPGLCQALNHQLAIVKIAEH